MTVNYTTNLSLGQPVTGTESGTWGDDVNNAVTSYLDIAIAGGLAITVTTTDVTLTITQGTSVATNIGSTTAQYAILNVSGAMTAARNLIVPSSSRIYLINNNTTGGFALTVKGSATSGVTLVNGEKAHVFWNGSDYAKLSNTSGGAGVFSSITNSGLTSGRVVYSTTGGLETDSANLTFNGTTLTANAVTLSGGTANGVTYLNASKVLTSGTALVFDGTSLGQGVTASSDYGFRQIFTGSGAVSQYGIHLDAFSDSSGTGNTIGIRAKARTSAAVYTSTSVVDFLADTIGLGAGSTITVAAGFLASDQTVGGTNIGFYSVVSSGANKYNIYASGTAQNYFSGSVGIGIVTPSAKLEVAGTGTTTLVKNTTTTAANGLQTNSTGGNFYFGIDSSTNNFYSTGTPYGRAIYSDGAYPIVFFTNATSRMTIDSSGNLGIGTTAPGARLEVVGASQIIQRYTGSATGFSIGQYNATGDASINNGANASLLLATNNTVRATIDSSGNLGIGTTSPSVKLQVATATASASIDTNSTMLGIGGTADTSGALRLIGFGFKLNTFYPAYIGAIQTSGAGNTFSDLGFYTRSVTTDTAPTERMRLDSSGNLGVGTTSPFTRLDSAAARATTLNSIALFNTMAASVTDTTAFAVGVGGGINFRAQLSVSSYSTLASIWSYKESATSGDYKGSLVFGTTANATGYPTEAMRLDSSGNLGIGTSSPSTYGTGLVVYGNLNGLNLTDGTYKHAVNSQGNTLYIKADTTGSGGDLRFQVNNVERARIDSSGNLLVGATASSGNSNLRVSSSTTRSYILVDTTATTGAEAGIRLKASRDWYNISDYDSGALKWFDATATAERMRLDSSGNLGIGTTTTNALVNSNSLALNVTSGYEIINHISGSVTGSTYVYFGYNAGVIGSIVQSGTTAVLYNTTSDQRLKENIQDAESASSLIDSLQVRQFDWKSDNSHQRYGFVAQELVTVAPEAVHQPADPEEMMAVDYSKLVPMLIKEIQSLRKRLAAAGIA